MLRGFLRAGESTLSALAASVRLRAVIRSNAWVEGPLWIRGNGNLSMGAHVRLEGGELGIELQVEPSAELHLGSNVVVGAGTSIEAHQYIAIGNGTRIGRCCKLLDNHLHPLRGERNTRPSSVPITIEDDVVIEDFAIVLPGAHIGRGAFIGRGAIVSRRVPPGAKMRAQPIHPAREQLLDGVTAARDSRSTVAAWSNKVRIGSRISSPPTRPSDPPRAPAVAHGAAGWSAQRLVQQVHVSTYIVRAHFELPGCELGPRVRVLGRVDVEPAGGRVVIGRATTLRDGPQPTTLLGGSGTTLRIGNNSVLNYGARVDARYADVALGDRCLLGSAVQLLSAPGQPVVVENEVWIAHGAVLEPGAHVGEGSVIGAGAVVSGRVPPRSLVMGNPGRAMNLDLLAEGRS